VAQTRYPLIKKIGKEMGWRLSTNEEREDWDIWWSDLSVPSEKLQKMREWQKVNHFPAMYQICRKNHLAQNLKILEKVFPEDYNFSPRTWSLPYDMTDLKSYIAEKKVLSMIVKPVAACQGRGIYLTK